MHYRKTIRWWLTVYKNRIASLFKEADGLFDIWIAFATLFNHVNLRIKRRTGLYFPFSIGVPEDGLKDPVGLDILNTLEKRLSPLKIHPTDSTFHFNIMIPTVNPELIFGGYIGLYNFVNFLLDQGYKIRLLVCEDVIPPIERLTNQLGDNSIVTKCLKRCEIIECYGRDLTYNLGKEDTFIGYSWITMRLAHSAAQSLNNKKPIFFIQEFEPIFHHYDSLRFLATETYSFQHNAIFNSPQLAHYFKSNKLGVFNGESPGTYCTFRHAISEIDKPSIDIIRHRTTKKLLIYARPERHAGRNLFEVSILALKEAIRQEIFNVSEWEFYGIGSLEKISKKIILADGIELKLLQKMSYSEYTKSLKEYDAGISLMYAPHPSVPPLEMASAGMLSITTNFENRTSADMANISKNIIAADHTITSLVSSILQAANRVSDYESRCDNANINWPISWEQSFGEQFSIEFEAMTQQT